VELPARQIMDVRVLIVDDSSTGRKLLKRSLPSPLKVDVTEAACGEDAVRICASEHIDVMFLDLTMPGMTGYDVLAVLQQQPEPPLVLVVSGDVQLLAEARVKQLGAFAFIKKPVNADTMGRVLRDAHLV
jgi:two-component system chemotaxis response regulator CheY